MSKHDDISERLNAVWSEGFAAEEYGGSCQGERFAAALILNDTDMEVDALQGIIVEKNQRVDYETFGGVFEAQARWRERMQEWAGGAV